MEYNKKLLGPINWSLELYEDFLVSKIDKNKREFTQAHYQVGIITINLLAHKVKS